MKHLRDMPQKWYQNRTIQASIISGFFIIILGILTTPLWLRDSKNSADSGVLNKIHTTKEKEEVKTSIVLNPVSLEIKPNISKEKIDPVIIAIRNSRKLRELTPLESGKSIVNTPYGTFFFVHGSSDLGYCPMLTESCFKEVLLGTRAQRTRDLRYSDFDVHYISRDQILLLEFVSSETAASISKLDGYSRKEVTLSPFLWDHVNTLILLPLDRIIKANYRNIRNTDNQQILVIDAVIQ